MASDKKKIIIDTGPLVAYLNKSDQFHEWAVGQFSRMCPPFYTCESVLSEACFLLRHYQNGIASIFKLIERELIEIPFHLEDEITPITKLLQKYKNIPMSLADGCLIRMSEQISDSVICTLDRDFTIYSKDKRKVVPLLIPEGF